MSASSPRRAALTLALLGLTACSSRPELPPPVLPLTRTPDAAFRAQAPPADMADAPKVPVVHEARLDNGTTVLVVERRSLPTATVFAVVRHAAREGYREPSGLGALTARTLLFGTRLSDGRVLANPSLFGRIPAVFSTDDAVVLGVETLSSGVPQAIGIVASLASRPVFTEAGLSQASSDQLDLIAVRSREAGDHLRQAALERLYGEGHGLARPPFGTSESVRSIPLARVASFHAARYRPSETAVVVVGDVAHDTVFETAARELGSFSSTLPAPAPDPPPVVHGRGGKPAIAAFRAGRGLVTFVVTVAGPGVADPDWLPFSLVGTALSGLALSRGNQALSHHDVKSYGVTRETRIGETSSELHLSFAVEPEDLTDSLGTMLRLIETFGQLPVSDEELRRVRAHYLTRLAEQYSNNWGCASLLAGFFARGRASTAFTSVPSEVASVTARDLRRAAQRWFSRDRVQITAVANPHESGYELAAFGRVEWFGFQSILTE
jgi:zinc protease